MLTPVKCFPVNNLDLFRVCQKFIALLSSTMLRCTIAFTSMICVHAKAFSLLVLTLLSDEKFQCTVIR